MSGNQAGAVVGGGTGLQHFEQQREQQLKLKLECLRLSQHVAVDKDKQLDAARAFYEFVMGNATT